MYLLDTNIISYWMQGRPAVMQQLQNHSPAELSLSSITLAEILYGIEKSPVKKEVRRFKLQQILSVTHLYEFDAAAAQSYALIRTQLEKTGSPISERDTQIAAIGLARNLTIVTHNVKEFNRVDRLRVEDWAVSPHL